MHLRVDVLLLAALVALIVAQSVQDIPAALAIPTTTPTASFSPLTQPAQPAQQIAPPVASPPLPINPSVAPVSPSPRASSPSRPVVAQPGPSPGSLDAFSTLSRLPVHSIFVNLISKANLTDVFRFSRDITVFAPTNRAFLRTLRDFRYKKSGDVATVQRFMTVLLDKQPVALNETRILLYHILRKRMTKREIESKSFRSADKDLMTRSGDEVEAHSGSLRDQAKFVPNPNFTRPFDVQVSNAVIHTMDRILLPTNVDRPALTKAVGEISKTFQSPNDPVCFPVSATVRTSDGTTHSMQTLFAGDRIQVSEHGVSSPVYLFSHRVFHGVHDFIRISTETGHSITLSASHYVYANGKLTAAGVVRVDDVLRTVVGLSRVTAVEMVREKGLVAPHTMHGDIIVNGVVASAYTRAVHPRIAHWLLAPIRTVVRMGMSKEPLGTMLYEGHERFARFLPSGPEMY